MADTQKPIDSDAALTSDDPQAQVASQGWGYIDPLGKAYGALKEGQQNAKQFDQDLSGSVQSMKDLVKTGVASNPQADEALAAHTNGMAMGTLKTPEELKADGFKFNHTLNKNKSLTIRVEDPNGNSAGHFEFTHDHPIAPGRLFPESSNVVPEHQRKGIASAAYQMAEDLTGKTVAGSNEQTTAGRSLWRQKGRQFGNDMSQMDENSRLARADQMGFDTTKTYYHGTNKDFDKFNDYGNGVWLAEHPEKAAEFSYNDGASILPVHAKIENPLVIDKNNEHLYKDMVTGVLQKHAKELGHDAIVYPDRGTVNVLDANNIKSKFAEFDPKKAKSGKLSYAAGGAVQHYADGTPDVEQQIPPPPPGFASILSPSPTNTNSPAPPPGFLEGVAPELKEEKYGTTGQQLKAGVEGVAQGLAGPVATYAETHLLNVKPDDIMARQEVNPATHFGGEVTGLLAPAIISGGASLAGKAGLEGVQGVLQGASHLNQAGALEAVGSALAKKLAPVSLAGKIGTGAARAAVENMLLASGDETSKMILGDPSASAHNAIASVALSGLLGGAIGGTMSGVGGLFDSKISGKTGQMIADFRGRIAQHIETPDPVRTMHEELSGSLNEMNKVVDDTFGANGIKADAISKLVPKEITPEIADQFTSISDKLDSNLDKLSQKSDPHAGLLEEKIAKFKQAANSQDTSTMFNAIQDLKQQLQSESRYTEGLSPLSERTYRSTVKNLAYDLRTSLEDSKVWGDAAHVQAEINGAASKYFPAIKDFKSLMTTKVMGESQIDPGKIQTYLNQLGKANSEIKQAKMQNFVDNSEMFKAAVNKAYERVGVESPIQPTPMSYTLSTLGEKTTGAKLADIFISKGLTDAGGKSMGAAVAGGIGHVLGGHGEIAALIGAHALGPFFSSVMPAVAESVLKLPASGVGFRAATNYGTAVAKGESLISQATKNIFRVGADVIPQSYMPTEKDRNKLQKVLDKLKVDPTPLLHTQNPVGHYMADHSSEVSKTVMTAVNYLNSLKPDDSFRQAPLDQKPVLSSVAKAKYQNAMNIAEQPMIVLDKLQKGTLNQDDMKAITMIYPDLYNRMKTKVMSQIVDAQTTGKIVPYKTRTALSLFLGMPIDSTMTPSAIQSMQVSSQGGQQNQQPQQSPAPKRSTASLSKMPSMYSTPNQTAESRRHRQD